MLNRVYENMDNIDKIIFLDFDHVLTNTDIDNTSFWSYDPSKYMLSKHNLAFFDMILSQTNAKVVIASNWRKFKYPNIYWEFSGKLYKSLLEEFKSLYKGTIVDMLPIKHGYTKCDCLSIWFNTNRWFSKNSGKYVILEDDDRERYQDDKTYSKHLVMTDYHVGLTENDAAKAITILNG